MDSVNCYYFIGKSNYDTKFLLEKKVNDQFDLSFSIGISSHNSFLTNRNLTKLQWKTKPRAKTKFNVTKHKLYAQ